MKRLLFAALFSLISYTSMAVASITITNNTNCQVGVQLFNFDPNAAGCPLLAPAGTPYAPVTIAPGSSTVIVVSAPASFPYGVGIYAAYATCTPLNPVQSTFTPPTCYGNNVALPSCLSNTGTTCNNAIVTWLNGYTVEIN